MVSPDLQTFLVSFSSISDGRYNQYRRGQHFAVDSISPICIVLHLKLISTVMLKELYTIENCATCLYTFLRF